MKKCNGKCQQTKLEDCFGKNSNSPDGLSYVCKDCNRARASEWYSKNTEKAKKRSSAAYRANPVINKKYDLKKYGLTVEDYDRMLVEQKSLCAICGQPEIQMNHHSGKILDLAVDHCHVTGKVRGLLCSRCNKMLGLTADSLEILTKAQEYLAKSQEGL